MAYSVAIQTNTNKAMELLQLKKQDKTKHYVKLVLDKVRRNDPQIMEVNFQACRVKKEKIKELEKALRR